MTNADPRVRLDAIKERLKLCGYCDCGLPAACTCPPNNSLRNDNALLVAALEAVLDTYDPVFGQTPGDHDEYAAGYRHRDHQVRKAIADALGGGES